MSTQVSVQEATAPTRRLRRRLRQRKKTNTLSVVIPALDEERNLDGMLSRLQNAMSELQERGWKYEVLLIDDGSTDRTARKAREGGARVIAHPYPLGNGAAVKRGIRAARGSFILLLDADGQHPPERIPDMLQELDRFDMVVGARGGTGHGWHRQIANKVFNALASWVTQRPILDLTSGFRCARADVLKRYCYLLPNTFSYPTTSTLAFLRGGYAVGYLPIRAEKRLGKSKVRITRDGIRFLVIIAKIATFFAPMRFFGPMAMLIAGLGVTNYVYTYVTESRFTNMSLLMVVLAAMTIGLGLISEQITALRFEKSERS